MICPSCKKEFKKANRCLHCGFNVSSYKQYSQSKLNEARQGGGDRLKFLSKKSTFYVLLIFSVFPLCIVFFLLSDRESLDKKALIEPLNSDKNIVQSSQVQEFSEQKTMKKELIEQQLVEQFDEGAALNENIVAENLTGVALRFSETHKPRNNVESARNATVFIETNWGTLGSGFIINDQCDVITNRHVLEEPIQQSDAFKASLKVQQDILNEKYIQLKEQQNNAKSQDRYDEISKELQRLLIKSQSLPKEIYQKMLKNKESSRFSSVSTWYNTFSVSLVNNEKFEISYAEISGQYDLAMFSIPDVGCPFLSRGNSDNLIQGDPLYTVGSPSGLLYSVTSGIFSGYRKNAEGIFLQTDAPINSGNSGGPLITKDGKVIGVNTAILKGTEGIGFAIPISVVELEFSL